MSQQEKPAIVRYAQAIAAVDGPNECRGLLPSYLDFFTIAQTFDSSSCPTFAQY
jgi:hypothetical protein